MFKRLLQILSSDYPLFLFIFFALLIRFLWLGTFPPGMAHDEFDMVLSSKAIAEIGKDLSGVPFPWFFIKTGMEAKQTNVIPFLLSPYFKFVELNLFTARLPFVLINLLLGWGLIKLIQLFVKDRLLTLIVLLVFLVNPWNFIFSRVTFAAPTALMFMVWGIYFLFKERQKIVLSLLAFILGSLSYMGSLVLTPLIAVSLFVYKALLDKKHFKKYVFSLLFFVVFVSSYILASHSIDDGTIKKREDHISVLSINMMSGVVDVLRRKSIEFPGKNWLINKYTIFLSYQASYYINNFNVNTLFISGDPRVNYTFNRHGLLYLVGFFLIIIGLVTLTQKAKKLMIIISLIALIAPLGPTINPIVYSIVYRAFPLMLVFVVLISFGLWELYKGHFKFFVLFIYFAFFANFFVFYFFEQPVLLEENFDVPERIAVNVALREKDRGRRVRVIVEIPYHFAKQVVFYDSKEGEYIIPVQDSYELDGIEIKSDCDFGSGDVVIVDQTLGCKEPQEKHLVIQQQKDAGYVYRIYGSEICEGVSLDSYKRFHKMSDYKIEDLDNKTFCNRWIFEPL